MSLLLIVISLVSYKKALSALASIARHSTPASEAILTKASMAILCSFAMSSSWSNKFFNREFLCKVVMVAANDDCCYPLSFMIWEWVSLHLWLGKLKGSFSDSTMH